MSEDHDVSDVDAGSLWRGMPEAIAREGRGIARLRNLSTAWRTRLALLGLGTLALGVWIAFGRVDWPVVPRAAFLLRWLPGALLATCSAGVLLWPDHRRAPGPWLGSGLLLASVALSLTPALLPELHRNHPASLVGAGDDLVPRALACIGIALLSGTACLAWVALFLQGPRRLGALPSSAWALFVIGQSALSSLHCPITAPSHLALGHGALGLLVLVVIGSLRHSQLNVSSVRPTVAPSSRATRSPRPRHKRSRS